jgi:hypothetical protein
MLIKVVFPERNNISVVFLFLAILEMVQKKVEIVSETFTRNVKTTPTRVPQFNNLQWKYYKPLYHLECLLHVHPMTHCDVATDP